MRIFTFLILLAPILVLMSCTSPRNNPEKQVANATDDEAPAELPFTDLSLTDLTSFTNPGSNWSTANQVMCDYTKEHDIEIVSGSGVLVNIPSDAARDNLSTNFEHGDIELKFEVMMPPGSNSGVYFQGRYEIQLFDSWKKNDPAHSDMGGIYQRWDESRPDGEKGFEGVAPRINAAIAPGLWQRYHVLFRAPRFDSSGEKIKDALFEYVYLNDMLIHEQVSVKGPTRAHHLDGEASTGPLFIQGDHGPVAFRNIKYKLYGLDTLTLSDLTYTLYHGKYDYIPDFDTLQPSKSGQVEFFDLNTASNEEQDGYSVVFDGTLMVPVSGDYLFETGIDDGGDLLIDSQLVVHNEGEPGYGVERGKIYLDAGRHQITMTYYQEVWSARLMVYYEGPEISRRPLASYSPVPTQRREAQPPIVLDHLTTPTLLRGFVMHRDEKLTHAISVGDPTGVHYSYDLLSGSLVKSWKGAFGDVTQMWRGRGVSQLLNPVNTAIMYPPGVPLREMEPNTEMDLTFKGYRIGSDERPVFLYEWNTMLFEDHVIPIQNERLRRTITLKESGNDKTWFKLGEAAKIIQMENGLFNMDGQYYIEADQPTTIKRVENVDQLLVQISDNISYEILW